MTTKEMKEWIDNANYEELLTKMKMAPVGSPFFGGKVGDYYLKKMREVRDSLSKSELTCISEKIDQDY